MNSGGVLRKRYAVAGIVLAVGITFGGPSVASASTLGQAGHAVSVVKSTREASHSAVNHGNLLPVQPITANYIAYMGPLRPGGKIGVRTYVYTGHGYSPCLRCLKIRLTHSHGRRYFYYQRSTTQHVVSAYVQYRGLPTRTWNVNWIQPLSAKVTIINQSRFAGVRWAEVLIYDSSFPVEQISSGI